MSADPHGADPFARSSSTSEHTIRWWIGAALGVSMLYLGYRLVFTLGGTDPLAAGLLLAAEVLAVVVFAVRARSATHAPIEVVVSPDAPTPDIAAVIDATGTSVDQLRTTLVAIRRVVGLERVIVVDREGSRWLRTIAERLDATVVDGTTSFDEAVVGAGTSWVLVLRSGDLPMPDLVTVCAPRCSSPDVAVIQVGTEEADPTTFDHEPAGHRSAEPFEQQVIRPGLASEGSIPWFGDGPALVRRAAVASLDSVGDGHMLDNAQRVGLDAIRRGMTVTHLPLTLARVRGPRDLGESLERRRRRAAAVLRVVRPARLEGVDGSARVAHLVALVPLVSALQRVLLVAAGVAVLAFGRVPVVADVVVLVALAGSSYLLRWTSHLVFGRGRLRPLSLLRSELRSLGSDLLPVARVHPWLGRTGLIVLVGAVLALESAVVVAAVAMWRDWDDRLPMATAVVALALTTGFLVVATDVLLDAFARRQRRINRRVRLGLVTCRIEEHDGQLVDLSTGGAGVVIAAEPEDSLEVGQATTVAFRIPDADGAWRNVSALVRIAHRSPDPDGGTRLGLSFDDPSDAPLDPVVEFLTIDRRLVALGRHEAART